MRQKELLDLIATYSRIEFPRKGQLRSRKVIFRTNYKHVSKFQSVKCGIRTVHAESVNEYNFIMTLEFDHTVVYFLEQPFKLYYVDDEGNVRFCFPDFLIYYDDGRMKIVEVKEASEAKKPETERRFELEELALRHHGYEFEVVTKEDIERGLRLENSRDLKHRLRLLVNPILRDRVLNALGSVDMSGFELCREIYGLTDDDLLSMLAHGCISTDLSKPLSPASIYSAVKRRPIFYEQQLRALERRCI